MEFVRRAATYASRVGDYRAKRKAQPGENAAIGSMHDLVGFLQGGLVGVKGVGILHQEFPGSHDAEARTNFVTYLGLDLVQVNRQLFVALDFTAYQFSNDLLMGRPKAEIPFVPVFDAQQLGAVLFPAARLLP